MSDLNPIMSPVTQIPVFISSPGDVPDERQRALDVIDRLNSEAPSRDQVQLYPIAWVNKSVSVPMEATHTPQDSVSAGLRKPSQCAIVIVIFWSRMGTPLPPDYLKPDGSGYLSGTESEYADAVRAHHASTADPKLPRVLIYRRTETPKIDLTDPKFADKQTQYQRVQDFFARFNAADGSELGGYNAYATPADFENLLEVHLRDWRYRLTQMLGANRYDPFALTPEQRRAQKQQALDQAVQKARERQAAQLTAPPSTIINPLPQQDMCSRFRDRLAQQDQIVNALKGDVPLVSVYGQGGIGKTALVCKVLADLQHDKTAHWDGMVNLSAGSQGTGISLERIVLDFIQALRGPARDAVDSAWRAPTLPLRHKIAALLDQLDTGHYALLLDNLETLQNPITHALADADLLEFFEVLFERGSPGLRVLTTSREPINWSGLRRVREIHIPLTDGLPDPDAIQLLRDLDTDGAAGLALPSPDAVGADLPVRPDDASLLTIAYQTHGFPRALEAAYALLKTPGMTLDKLLHAPVLLSGKVDALIEEAIRRLDLDALRVMEALAVYGQPLSEDGLAYLLAPYLDITSLPGTLDRLVSGYFVSFNQATESYALHPIDQSVRLARVPEDSPLPPAGEGSGVRAVGAEVPYTRRALLTRAADYHRSHRTPQDTWKTLADLDPQLLEIDYRSQAGDYDTAANVLTDIDGDYLLPWGHATRVIELHERLQGHITRPALAMFSLLRLGLAYVRVGRVRAAIHCYEGALKLARQQHNRQKEGAALGNLGMAYADLGQVQTSIDYYQQALVIAGEIGDRRSEGAALGNLGIAYYSLGQVQTAIDYCQQALVIAREIGDRRGEGADLGNLGIAFYSLGRVQTAIDCFQQALVIKRGIGDRYVEATAQVNLGIVLETIGDLPGAIAAWREAERCYRSSDAPAQADEILQWIANAGG